MIKSDGRMTSTEHEYAGQRRAGSGLKKLPFDNYQTVLVDKYRPPRKGGNTGAWHSHIITIAADRYSFLALGVNRWLFKGDTVSFNWKWDESTASVISTPTHWKRGTSTASRWCGATGEVNGGAPLQRGYPEVDESSEIKALADDHATPCGNYQKADSAQDNSPPWAKCSFR